MRLLNILALLTVITFTSCSEKTEKKETKATTEKETSNSDVEPKTADAIEPSNTDELLVKIDPITNETMIVKTVNGKEVVVDTVLPPEAIEVLIAETKDPIVDDSYDFHLYEKYDAFLNSYVSAAGKVNYANIKSNKSELTAILKEFKDNYPASDWTTNQKLSYWINAYNVFTIQLIVDNYPTTSITNITAKPWLKKFVKVGSQTFSLNHIENGIIRKQFNEPRIHFALNCASKSCPVLLNSAYTSSNLQSLLTSQTKRFLNDTSKNTYGKKTIEISQLFDWYKEDFTKSGTVIDFINKYRTEQLQTPKITYGEYSWDLNN